MDFAQACKRRREALRLFAKRKALPKLGSVSDQVFSRNIRRIQIIDTALPESASAARQRRH